jgi:flagellar biosynthesis activator protein FlaF
LLYWRKCMSRASYAQTLGDDPVVARRDERMALLQLMGLLDAAVVAGPGSREAVNALSSVNAVWSFLLEDLVRAENDLPMALRAHLISIGIFLLKVVEEIRAGRSADFGALRDIISTIAEGLA